MPSGAMPMFNLGNTDIVMVSRVILMLKLGGVIFWTLSLILLIKLDKKKLGHKSSLLLLIPVAFLSLAWWFGLFGWELLGIVVFSVLLPFFAPREKRNLSFVLSSMGLLFFFAGQIFFLAREPEDTFFLLMEGNYVSAFAPSIFSIIAVWLSAISVFFLAIKLKKQDKQICA
jgi:signal transduction histidine kinase